MKGYFGVTTKEEGKERVERREVGNDTRGIRA